MTYNKEWSAEYYKRNKEHINEYALNRYYNNKEKIRNSRKEYEQEYHRVNYIKRREATRRYNQKKRAELISVLGGKCVKCGFDDVRALQVDHINGGGSKDNANTSGMKNKVMLDRIKSGDKSYQLLCANCNWIKRFNNNETANKFK